MPVRQTGELAEKTKQKEALEAAEKERVKDD